MNPLVNGVQHSWASVRINMLGRTITGVSSINYSDNQNMENIYGAGVFPDHQGIGNYEATASIELYQYEVVALQEALAGARIQQLPSFDIIVAYLPTGNAASITDVIRNVKIKNNLRALSQGDTMSKVSLELLVSHIDWHGQIPGSGGL